MHYKLTLHSILISIIVLTFGSCNDKKSEKANASQANEKKTVNKAKKSIVFFGNSITAGYGLSIEQSFPSRVQSKIDSLQLNYTTTNAGLSGETTASGVNRVNWILKQPVDIFVLELGANDGLRGIPTEETYKNLKAIIGQVRAKNNNARIILAGMKVPPNMGKDYATRFEAVFTQVATEEKVELIPFLLDGVAGIPELNQADGIHPTATGAQLIANLVWDFLDLKKD